MHLFTTVTEKLTTVDNTANSLKSLNDEYNSHIVVFNKCTELQKSVVINIDQPLLEFLGNPPVTAPNLATIKTAIDNLAKLRSDYDTHINAFGALRKNFNRTDDAVDKFFNKKKYQTGGY